MHLHRPRQSSVTHIIAAIMAPICSVQTPFQASAEPLPQALAFALRHNPSLAAERADLRVSGEDIVEARAPGQPRASLLASHTETLKKAIPSTLTPDRTLRSDVTVSVPIYRGGTVKYAMLDARRRYDAGTEGLRASTSSLLGAVVIAYCDVLRDEAVVRLSEGNVDVLAATLRGTRGRFRIGDVTVTDVAQSEARLEQARSNLGTARAQLASSEEEYVRVIGRAPVALQQPATLPGLPPDVETAVATALRANGALLASRLTVEATGYRIRAAQGERDVRLTAVGSGGYYDYLHSVSSTLPFRPNMNGSSVQLGVTLELPLYQGGLPASRVRRAREERASAIEREIAAERGVIAQVRAAYANWRLLRESERSAEAAIVANERALKGAKAENGVGTRTLLDVLNTERDLLSSQVELVSIRRDAYVAAFALLVAMGRADPEDLNLVDRSIKAAGPPAPRRSWSDWADGARAYSPAGTSTMAVDTASEAVRPE